MMQLHRECYYQQVQLMNAFIQYNRTHSGLLLSGYIVRVLLVFFDKFMAIILIENLIDECDNDLV